MKSALFFCALAFAPGAFAASHPFDVHDLVMMNRVSDPRLSPDGEHVAFQMRETDYAENKGVNGIWMLDLSARDAKPVRLTDKDISASSPRWSADGKSVYYLAQAKGDAYTRVWRMVAISGAKPESETPWPADINTFKLSPDGATMLLSIDVFEDCAEHLCTKRPPQAGLEKTTGRIYDRLFVRHWDVWSDRRRSQLYIAPASTPRGGKGMVALPRLLSKGIDGDIPSKPFGDDTEFAFAPDGKTVYFDVRIAGRSEPWSTNFDVYSVPADGSSAPKNLTAANLAWDAYPRPSRDGKTLYYLAMKMPGFEADRFGIMAMDLATGAVHEVDPHWDRSAGPLQLSADGKTLYTMVDDNGDHALFGVDIASGKATRLVGDGTVTGLAVGAKDLIVAREDFSHPVDLYRYADGKLAQITDVNAARLADVRFSKATWFTFKGWNGDTVHGYAMPPVDAKPGQKYPVAFLIHGGPQGAWTNEFHYRWTPETYAGAGFGVVAINFHGSTGYGQAFTDAISRHWGDRPLEDLQKGYAAALKEFPYLDGSRACALGASYGGYMTYWIAGVWNKPWKCLVDHDGVFDTRMMYYATEELWFEEHENGGTQYDVPANYEKFNPLDHVKDWRVPMLVVHSSHDYRIPIDQGLGAFTALQRRGIPSEFLTFPDESHFVQKPQNSVLWHDTVNAWLRKWTAQ
ncbi:MAG: S9 family peptidase [Xanthomonadaceae bacterium]|nr:S9 family peptidase [Xanthomonadaceae bacterium]MDE2084914.1 S9 family peptidase [Xanthomonadaceae bacterium]